MTSTVDSLIDLFEQRGDSQYGGEAVTQLEHALQAAALAEADGATPELIAAALLHDVGHLVHDLPDDAPDHGRDDHHEARATPLLRKLFPDAVVEPVRLHVAAKRYLCAVEEMYILTLSGPSLTSLELQGGPMNEVEVAAFESNPFANDAVRLRKWDDTAKDPECETAPFAHFAQYLRAVAR